MSDVEYLTSNDEKKKTGEEKRMALYNVARRRCFYSFENIDLSSLYSNSSEFRKAVNSGKYVYVEGHIILNSPQCLEYRQGKPQIRGGILDDPARYCLARKRVLARYGKARFAPAPKGPRARRDRMTTKYRVAYTHAEQIESFQEVTVGNVVNFIAGGGGKPPSTFGKALEHYMRKNRVTQERLGELTGLSQKTIQRMCKDEERPSIRHVVAVCIALMLSQWDCLYLVHVAGYTLTYGEEDRLFFSILMRTSGENNTVSECNQMLKRLGKKPLTKL